MGKGFGLSAQRKAELALSLFDRGIIQDPREVMSVVEFGTTNKLFYENSLSENQATRYLKMIVEGNEKGEAVTPPYSDFQDHPTIIKVFTDFMKTPEYDNEITDEQRQVIESYLERHLQAMQPAPQEQPQQGQSPAPQGAGSPPVTQSQMDDSKQLGGRPVGT